MNSSLHSHDRKPTSDYFACRDLLLHKKRHTLLDAEELRRAGTHLYGDAGSFCLYGKTVEALVDEDFRIVGRTAIECCIDQHAIFIAKAVQRRLQALFPSQEPLVIDLFVGSGNLLYHVANGTEATSCLGFERNRTIYRQTCANFSKLGFQANLQLGSFSTSPDTSVSLAVGTYPVVLLIDPPWGDAYSEQEGLDLRRTNPPLMAVLQALREAFRDHQDKALCVIKTSDRVTKDSLTDLSDRYPVYDRDTTRNLPEGNNLSYIICGLRHA